MKTERDSHRPKNDTVLKLFRQKGGIRKTNRFHIVVLLLMTFFGRTLISSSCNKASPSPIESPSSRTDTFTNNNSEFQCDGRVYCSQMTSCEEAEYFLNNCPDVKMDGDGDGIPCEDQWCR